MHTADMLAIMVAAALTPDAARVDIPPPVAGLSLPLRLALTLQQQGASRILWVGDERQGLTLAADARLALPLEIVPTPAGQVDMAALQTQIGGPFVMLDVRWLMAPSHYRTLLLASTDAAKKTDAAAEADAADQRAQRLGSVGMRAMADGHFVHAIVAGPSLLGALAETPRDWRQLGEWARLTTLSLADGWTANVTTEEGRRHAFGQLFDACRKPVDGVVSRYLNRHVSLFVSKQLVNTAVTPNAMTAVTFAVGLVAAWVASRGGYFYLLAGAALMQLNSILDGCDGELARVRFEGSKLGQWLDTIGDDVSNVIFWLALGVAAQQVPTYGAWLAICAWLAAAGNGLAAAQYYFQLWRIGSGDFYALQADDKPPPPGVVGALIRFFSVILKQDFFLLLVLVLAAADVLLWSLPVMALGALITLASATGRTFAQRRRRGESQPHAPTEGDS